MQRRFFLAGLAATGGLLTSVLAPLDVAVADVDGSGALLGSTGVGVVGAGVSVGAGDLGVGVGASVGGVGATVGEPGLGVGVSVGGTGGVDGGATVGETGAGSGILGTGVTVGTSDPGTGVLGTGVGVGTTDPGSGVTGTGIGIGVSGPTGPTPVSPPTTVDPLASAPVIPGHDALTIGGYAFDPYTLNGAGDSTVEGFEPVSPVASAPPFSELGGGAISATPTAVNLAPQGYDVYSPTGTLLGDVTTHETVTDVFGMANTEFTVDSVAAVTGGSAANLPVVGSVYDSDNFGGGFFNVYTAVPGTAAGSYTTTDTLVTPLGQINLSALVADITPALNPGSAFAGLENATGAGGADAFLIGNLTFDPSVATTEGYNAVAPEAGALPLFELGGGRLGGEPIALQSFTVYDGSSATSPEIGSIVASEDVANVLGASNTQFIVETVNQAGVGAPSADLPTVGSLVDVFNLGGGVANVYVETPGGGGSASDTLITPYGNVNLSNLLSGLNMAAAINPGAALVGLEDATSAGDADAFAIGDVTFDPYVVGIGGVDTAGFATAPTTFGIAPFFEFAGGSFGNVFGDPLTQHFTIYDGTDAGATDVGSIDASEHVINLFRYTNTEFTVTSVAAGGADASALPSVGSVYDVFNFGDGFENVYTAVPGVAAGADTITDTLVTPFGNLNLDSLFGGVDALAALDPGAAFGAASTIDPLAFLGL